MYRSVYRDTYSTYMYIDTCRLLSVNTCIIKSVYKLSELTAF